MKDVKKIIYVLIILNIILMITLIFWSKIKTNDSQLEITKLVPATVEDARKIYPEGSFKFTYLYDGEINLDNFYGGIYKFVNYIKNIYKDIIELSDEQIGSYYYMNKEVIFQSTGISKLEDYQILVNQIKKCNVEDNYTTIKMIEDTYTSTNQSCEIEIDIIYGNGKSVRVKAYFSKFYSDDKYVRFLPIEEET